MKTKIEIPYHQYALIAELARRLEKVSPQFGKTALQKLVFFLQTIYHVDCGYDFELYSYGPFDSTLLSDLDMAEHWGLVSVERVNESVGGFHIAPTDKVNAIRDKAADFLDADKTRKALDALVATYGGMKARELEIRATTVYVERSLHTKGIPATRESICHTVGQIKPKFSELEIDTVVSELNKRRHIILD